jgi:hypothetical protein
MRRLLVPIVTLFCLCCATLPRQTRTEVQALGGAGTVEWSEPSYGCGGIPPAHQMDQQFIAGLAVKHEHADGFEFAGTVEGMRETVVKSDNHPTPPDGARDYVIGGGGFVGARSRYLAGALGLSATPSGAMPYGSFEAGKLDLAWAHLQVGRWRPLSDARIVSLGVGFKPMAQIEGEVWVGLTSAAIWRYPVATRLPAAGEYGNADLAAGAWIHGQVNEYVGFFAQLAAAEHPSGFVGLTFSPWQPAAHTDDDPEVAE